MHEHMNLSFMPCPGCGAVHRPVMPELMRSASWRREFKGLFLPDTSINSILDQLGSITSHTSLNTAYSNTGANEVTGGSPAFARKAITWASAASGAKALAATLPSFDVASGLVIPWWSGWSALTAGTFRFMAALGGGTLMPAMVELAADITANDIFAKAHGLVADNRVVPWPASATTLPTGLAVGGNSGIPYWVISTGLTTDSFRLSLTQGGSAIDITGTSPFGFFVQKCVPQTTVTQDVLTFGATQIDGRAVL